MDAANLPESLQSQLLISDGELRDVVEEFVRSLDGRLAELRDAYDRLDFQQLTALAHRLKGAGGSYGYPALSNVAAGMEERFRRFAAEDFDGQLAALERLAEAARNGLTAGS
ncbi:MAG: Hpt domain-containing protein [Phycisphaerales bacterium]|nr:Hpt domain-containing protein [Phycisphaerales bacterium]